MNRHTTDAIDEAVRSLDSAPETALTEAERHRADAGFVRIVATPSDDLPLVEFDRPRRRWRLLVPIGLIGAAGVAILVPLLSGGSAFASWTATPEPLTPAEASAAAATCRAGLRGPVGDEVVMIAERRGKWTYVLMSGPGGERNCVMRNDVVGQDLAGREISGSYATDPGTAPNVSAEDLVEAESMADSVEERWSRNEWLTWTRGYVGSDVTGVTVHTPLGFDVEASVDNGRFVAWWPSDKPSSENLDVMGAWSYTVTLADGSTRDISS